MTELKKFIENWKSPFVAREKLEEFSGGLLKAHTMRNLDSQGTGIKGRIKIGKKVIYPTEEIVAWLEAKITNE